MNRIIKLTIALVVAMSGFLVAGATVSGAQGVEQSARSVTAATGAPASKALPLRSSVVVKWKRKSNTAFKVWAKISPAGGKKRVQLRYARTEAGPFRVIRRDKMNKNGRADFGRVSKLGVYVVVVPKSKRYARTGSSNGLKISRR